MNRAHRTGHIGAISAHGVSKSYRMRQSRPWLIQTIYRGVQGDLRRQPLKWALRDVTVEVDPGGSLGIIGRNGAGKSTLLKILAGITRPSAGRVETHGRVATQFGLGNAFDPLLTGRQNVFLEGTVLGLTNAEVRRRLDSTLAFAELDGAIDEPLWTYSSGMVARLGFAVAAHADFDLLFLDEALSAGDAAFRERCAETLRGFRSAGKTLVIVSHGLASIRDLCERVLWLDGGTIQAVGPAVEILARYEQASGVRREGPAREAEAFS